MPRDGFLDAPSMTPGGILIVIPSLHMADVPAGIAYHSNPSMPQGHNYTIICESAISLQLLNGNS